MELYGCSILSSPLRGRGFQRARMLELYLNVILAGLLTGLVYGLSALGLSVIFGVVRVVNFAHGELMMIGMFLSLLVFQWSGIQPLVAMPAVAAVLFLIGYLLQAVLVNRLIGRPDYMQFLMLVGVATMIVAGSLMIFGPDARNAPLSFSLDTFQLWPPGEAAADYAGIFVSVDKARVYAALAALAIGFCLFLFFRFTLLGKAIRACGDSYDGALVVGLNVRRIFPLTFGLGAAIAGAAGCIILMLLDVHPYLAEQFTLLGFIIVIIGGLGSMPGALLGGVLLGVSEALAGVVLQPSMKQMFSFGLLILVLLLRPQGLLGRRSH
jgi:branched-chain amino acid transport system permease protein